MSNTIYVHFWLHTCATLWLFSIKSKLSRPKWLRSELNLKVMLLFNCKPSLLAKCRIYNYTLHYYGLSKLVAWLLKKFTNLNNIEWDRNYNYLPENGEYNKALYYFQFTLFKNSFCHHFTYKNRLGHIQTFKGSSFPANKIIKSWNFWNC